MQIKKIFFIINLMLATSSLVSASTGSILGKVIDASTGEELIGATVLLTGTTTGTITDYDGKYQLDNILPGSYSITFSYVSFETVQVEGVEVQQNNSTVVNANLMESITNLQEVQVVARHQQKTEAALQVLQRKSATVLDGITSEHMSKLGDGDAAGALKRVTGVSVLDGKYVFVRGLSERYMKVTLNSAEIPGLDPDVNTVQMDLFPSSLIENIIVYKTFSPDLITFTGGNVDIVTRDFPDQSSLNFSMSIGYNPQSNLNKSFLTYKTGKLDWLGFDDGTRQVPEIVKNKEWEIFISDADTVGLYTRAFNNNWNTTTKRSSLNQSYSLSYGNSYNLKKGKLGIIAALSYKKDFLYFGADNGSIKQLSRNGSVSADLSEEYGNEEVIWSSLLGLTYKINNYNKIGFNFLRNQSGASGARIKTGTREIYPGGTEAQETSPEYVQRSLSCFQLKGKHVVPALANFQIDWFGSSTYSTQDEPDMRFWYNTFSVADNGDTTFNMIPNTQPLRYYRYMDEQDFHGNIKLTLPLDFILEKSKFKIGSDFVSKDRLSEEYQFTLKTNFGSADYNGNQADYLQDSRLINEENVFEGGSIYYSSRLFTNDIYSYTAREISASGFAMIDVPVSTILRVVGGVKYEYTDVFVENMVNADSLSWDERYNPDWNSFNNIRNKYKSGDYTTRDWLPSVNLTFFLSQKTNLRLNFWKSISKPALREIAPLSYYDFLRGIRFTGNAELERSINYNFDLRLEHFFKNGELISVSAFYKILQDPIEIYAPDATENTEYLYRNGVNTDLYGIETEFRKALGFFSFTKNLLLGLNMTLVYSQIKEEEGRLSEALQINPEFPTSRPMFGQAPYTLNSYLLYSYPKLGMEANIAFNVSGPKLIIISQAAAPNVYEMPYKQLDFNISKKIGKKLTFKFEVNNVLNQEHRTSYVNNDVDKLSLSGLFNFIKSEKPVADFRSYKTGTEFIAGFSYSF